MAPLAAEALDCYPGLRLELISGETLVDLIEERVGVAIRIGNLADSILNARRLGSSRLRLLAALLTWNGGAFRKWRPTWPPGTGYSVSPRLRR